MACVFEADQPSLFALPSRFLFRSVSVTPLLRCSLPSCMSFRRVSSAAPNSSYSNYPQSAPIHTNQIQHYQPADQSSPTSPSMRKRPRTLDMHPPSPPSTDSHPPTTQGTAPQVADDAFINDQDAVDSAAEDEEDEEKPKSDKKAGRRKIKIEFIQDKSRRHITFSKRKAGMRLSPTLFYYMRYSPPFRYHEKGKFLFCLCLFVSNSLTLGV
jgi:hypothetical protein